MLCTVVVVSSSKCNGDLVSAADDTLPKCKSIGHSTPSTIVTSRRLPRQPTPTILYMETRTAAEDRHNEVKKQDEEYVGEIILLPREGGVSRALPEGNARYLLV